MWILCQIQKVTVFLNKVDGRIIVLKTVMGEDNEIKENVCAIR